MTINISIQDVEKTYIKNYSFRVGGRGVAINNMITANLEVWIF